MARVAVDAVRVRTRRTKRTNGAVGCAAAGWAAVAQVLVPRDLVVLVRARGRGEIEMAVPVEITHGNTVSTTGSGGHHDLCPKSTQAVGVLVPRDLVVTLRGRGEIEMPVPVEITHDNTTSITDRSGHDHLLAKQGPTGDRVVAVI